jgi:hypothetical protein
MPTERELLQQKLGELASSVDTQTAVLAGLVYGEGYAERKIHKEGALLAALTSREAGIRSQLAAIDLLEGIADLKQTITNANAALKEQIADFSSGAKISGDRLNTWTKVLAFATIALVLATAGLVWVTLNEPPQTILIGKP